MNREEFRKQRGSQGNLPRSLNDFDLENGEGEVGVNRDTRAGIFSFKPYSFGSTMNYGKESIAKRLKNEFFGLFLSIMDFSGVPFDSKKAAANAFRVVSEMDIDEVYSKLDEMGDNIKVIKDALDIGYDTLKRDYDDRMAFNKATKNRRLPESFDASKEKSSITNELVKEWFGDDPTAVYGR